MIGASRPGAFDRHALEALCVPTDKNGEGIRHPGTDLVCYKVLPRRATSRPEVTVRNQFGPDRLAVGGPRTLCVPSAVLEP